MKVSHSNTLWLGYKLYSSFVLHGRITLLPLPTLPLGRHHSLQHPCYHYLADSCITYEPYTVLIIGKVLGGITDQHVVSRDALFFFLKFLFSRPSFISSIFRSLPLFSPSFCSFFHFLFVSFIISRSFSCSFRLSPSSASFVHSYFLAVASFFHLFILFRFTVCPLPLSFIYSFSLLSFVYSFLHSFVLSFIGSALCSSFQTFFRFVHFSFIHSFFLSPYLSFFLTLFLLFFLSYLLLLFLCFDHSLPLILSLFCYLFYLFCLSFVLSFVHSFFCSFVHSFLLPLHFSHSFFLSLSSLELSFVRSFIHSFILSLLDR